MSVYFVVTQVLLILGMLSFLFGREQKGFHMCCLVSLSTYFPSLFAVCRGVIVEATSCGSGSTRSGLTSGEIE
ncbi:hypothetical protein B0T09DRAFT_339081 [Sordaria sp. MPI-SDFR-AT-0083]|nr:hypothetical protein B0T09DRAFT_339081 [Sordaria sp. MPI-SDFR-AT-0083]